MHTDTTPSQKVFLNILTLICDHMQKFSTATRIFDHVKIRLRLPPHDLTPCPIHHLASSTSSSSSSSWTSLSLSTTSYLLCPIVFQQILNVGQTELSGAPFGPQIKVQKKSESRCYQTNIQQGNVDSKCISEVCQLSLILMPIFQLYLVGHF